MGRVSDGFLVFFFDFDVPEATCQIMYPSTAAGQASLHSSHRRAQGSSPAVVRLWRPTSCACRLLPFHYGAIQPPSGTLQQSRGSSTGLAAKCTHPRPRAIVCLDNSQPALALTAQC